MNSASPLDPAEQARFDEFLADANRHYEADEYTAAIRDYRKAASICPLDGTALACLESAEDHEPIVAHRRLAALWPDSIDHALAEVQARIRAGYPAYAVRRCTEILGRADLTPSQIRNIRCVRFWAAGRSSQPAEFAADFLFIWNVTRGEPTQRGARLALMRDLVTIGSPRLLEALGAIGDTLADDPELTRIVASKVEPLTILKNLEAARTRERAERRSCQ